MSVRSRTERTYVCDLCGAESGQEMQRLYMPGMYSGGRQNYRFCDICQDCLSRPVSDVLAFFSPRLPHGPDCKDPSCRGDCPPF